MKKFNKVNWQGKMKLLPDHFIQTENYYNEQINDIRSLIVDKFNFGLLPTDGEDSETGIRIREHITKHVEVSLYSCNAVTASGERIEYRVSGDNTPLSHTFSPQTEEERGGKSVGNWDVILSVDPYERKLTGELDPADDPPRHPDCEASFKLHVVPSDEVNLSAFGSHFVSIGKIRKEGERYKVDTNYIPPCMKMSSHPELKDYCMRFDSLLYSINKSSEEIIAKVYNKSHGNELATNIQKLSKITLQYITSVHFRLRNFGVSLHPVVITEQMSVLASRMYVGLICMPGGQKDELLKYFYEWNDVTPGTLEELLANTMEITYDHRNLRSVMVRLESFATVISELWDRLSKLEYIGQHKESLVVSVTGGQSRGEERKGYIIQD